jgi:hypothetical protein
MACLLIKQDTSSWRGAELRKTYIFMAWHLIKQDIFVAWCLIKQDTSS